MDYNALKKEIMDAHNAYRELHSTKPLKYSANLESSAQAWAVTLSDWHILAYSPENNVFSENVAEVRNPKNLKGSQVVDAWYIQEKNYDYENFNHVGSIDQFAVMIWDASQKMGVGIKESADYRIFIVIHYSPPGLMAGGFEENVHPPKTYTGDRKLKSKKILPKSSASCKVLKHKDTKSFYEDCLNKINAFRIQHNSPPLILKEELCESASAQAKFCATNNALITQSGSPVGQVFLEMLKPDFIITGGLAPRHWYAESLGYNYKIEPKTDQYNNFTQLVWKGSQEFGIGVAASLNGVLYVIGHFLPRGNEKNRYITNVFPTKEQLKLCPCGCGYTAPACVQDLTTTILSKVPTHVSHASDMAKELLTNRTFTVLSGDQDNEKTRTYDLATQEITVLREDSRFSRKILSSRVNTSEVGKISHNTSQQSKVNPDISKSLMNTSAPMVATTSKNNALPKDESKLYKLSQSKMSMPSKPSLNLDIKKLKDQILQSHNKYRALHNTPPLEYSSELGISAQDWSDTLAVVLILTYSPTNSKYSENCAEVRNPFDFKGEEVTDLWYSQQKNYDYENLNHSGPVDQYCVMIWKDSQKVGFGISVSGDQRVFVVAHYSPPGLLNNFETNILPPKGYQKPSVATKPFVPVEATSKNYKGIKKEELQEFHEDALGKLNNFRLRHNSPALKLNDDLCKSALDQAKRSATNQMLLKSNDSKYGETYLELTLQDFTITGGLASRHWYAESVGYVYNVEPRNDQYHNFTQLVWKNSKEMGIGVAASLQGVLYVIGHYIPPGNTQNQYTENVLSPKESNKFCACGCGYVSPACVKDLQTTIISKLPSLLASQKSKTSRFDNSVRSFSVLDNSKILEKESRSKAREVTRPVVSQNPTAAKDSSLRGSKSKGADSLAPGGTEQNSKIRDTLASIQNRSMRSIIETTKSKEETDMNRSVERRSQSLQEKRSTNVTQKDQSLADKTSNRQSVQQVRNTSELKSVDRKGTQSMRTEPRITETKPRSMADPITKTTQSQTRQE